MTAFSHTITRHLGHSPAESITSALKRCPNPRFADSSNYEPLTVDTSEHRKVDGSLSCPSPRF